MNKIDLLRMGERNLAPGVIRHLTFQKNAVFWGGGNPKWCKIAFNSKADPRPLTEAETCRWYRPQRCPDKGGSRSLVVNGSGFGVSPSLSPDALCSVKQHNPGHRNCCGVDMGIFGGYIGILS